MKIIEDLKKIAEPEYGDFEAKLAPTIPRHQFLGVRIPKLRKYAKTLTASEVEEFFGNLPHRYYDENILHSILISNIKDYGKCIDEINRFIPFIDNWAVCDTLRPKVVKNNLQEFYPKALDWLQSKEPYICRFGIEMLMTYYMDQEFKTEDLVAVSEIQSDHYYVNMMIAWYFATALAKKWEYAFPYIKEERLSKWVHNKTIQKSVESYRISPEQKNLLRSYRKK